MTSNKTINYFAFGSNLTRARLFARVGVCEVLGRATVADHTMSFRKRSHDGTAKCDLYQSDGDIAEGAVFRMQADRQPVLDRFEGVGAGYDVISVSVTLAGGEQLTAVAYQAVPPWITDELLPFQWYRDYVLEGGRAFGLSDAWLARVRDQACMSDTDKERAALNASILSMSDEQAHQLSIDGGSS